MANRSVAFNGKTIVNPGVYSSIDSSMTYSKQSTGSRIIALIGESTGGEPNKVHFLSNPSEAKKVLKSGELLKACTKAWNPVSRTKDGLALGGADIIACIRANKAIRATRDFMSYTGEGSKEVYASISDLSTGSVVVEDGDSVEPAFCGLVKVEIVEGGTLSTSAGEITVSCYNCENVDTPLVTNQKVKFDSSSAELSLASIGYKLSFLAGVYTSGDCFFASIIPANENDEVAYRLVSKDYGKDNNKIQVKVEQKDDGFVKVSVYDVKSDTYEIYDNVGKAFSIKYTGEGTCKLHVVTNTDGESVRLMTVVTPGSGSAYTDLDVELSKSAFRTIRALVRHLQGFENYNVVYNNYCNIDCSVNDLDRLSADISGKEAVVSDVLADMKAKMDADSSFVTVEYVNRAVYDKSKVKTEYVSLAGGSEGVTPRSWAEYFDMLGRYDIQYIVPLTSDEIILSECREHVIEMSENFGLERRAVVGLHETATIQEATNVAQNLASDRVQMVYPGFYDLDDNGENTLYPAYILAAQFAGRISALPDGETATHDVFRMKGIEKELEPDEIKELLAAGVVTFEFKVSSASYNESYVQCVQDLTTSREDGILRVERAVGVVADNINRDIRAELDTLSVGRKTTVGLLTTIKNIVERILEDKRDKEQVIVDYKDVSVVASQDVITIEYACAPTIPNNFTLVSGHFYSQDLFLSDSEETTQE